MGKGTTLVHEGSLMQPFLPGSPTGRGGALDGDHPRITDERWEKAFPNCKWNKYLAGKSRDTYAERLSEHLNRES